MGSKYVLTSRSWILPSIRVLGIVLIFGIVPAGTKAQPLNAPDADASSVVSGLYDWIGLVRSFQEGLNLSELSADDLVFAREFDVDALIEFVRQDIRFQQYPGTMRGKPGTLVSRAGNALDQAILLASLIKDAGYEARIAQGELSRARVEEMLLELFSPLVPQPVLTPHAVQALTRMNAHARASLGSDWSESSDVEQDPDEMLAARLERALVQVLESSSRQLGQRPVPETVLSEASDYYWVQYRLASGDDWVDVHPVFRQPPDWIDSLEPNAYLASSVPSEAQQRIALQVMGSRRIGNKSEKVALTSRWERPLANMFNVSLPIRIMSLAGPVDDDAETDHSDNELFVVYFGDSAAPGAKAFTPGGNIVDAQAASSEMAGVFAEVSGKSAQAAAALMAMNSKTASGEEPEAPAMQLQAVWLDIEVIAPGNEKVFRTERHFASSEGSQMISRNALLKSMVLETHYGAQAVARTMDMAMNLHVEGLELAIAQHRSAVAQSHDPLFDELRRSIDWRLLESTALFAQFAEYRVRDPEVSATYLDFPMVVIRHMNLTADSDDPTGIDIVLNSRRSFQQEDGNVVLSPALSFSAGIWEAISEHEFVKLHSEQANSAVAQSLASMDSSGFELVDDAKQVEKFVIHPLARERVRAALEQSRVVIFPESSRSGPWPTWWELDAATGEVLGVTANGWGGGLIFANQLTERVILDKTTVALTCLIAFHTGCTLQSKMAVSALQNALMSGGGIGAILLCEAIMQVVTTGATPDMDVCGTLAASAQISGAYAAQAVSALQKPLYRWCFRGAPAKCAQAAAAVP